jgi:hypothetical protein
VRSQSSTQEMTHGRNHDMRIGVAELPRAERKIACNSIPVASEHNTHIYT